MAERANTKAKTASREAVFAGLSTRGRRGSSGDLAAQQNPAEGGGALEQQQHANLIAELEVARAQIALLEQQREQFINRIDSMIDSLHGLLVDKR